jgi:hypothetical protein
MRFPDFGPGPAFVGEEMIAMIRVPRVRLVLVVAALLVLLAVPMVGARALTSPSVHPAAGGWLGAALTWAQGLAGLQQPVHRHGHSGSQPNRKDGTIMQPAGGGCVDPMGHPRLCF